MEKKELEQLLSELKTQLEQTASDKAKAEVKSQIEAVEKQIAEIKGVTESVKGIETSMEEVKAYIKQDEADKKANQEALDKLIAESKNNNKAASQEKKSFGQVFAEAVEENWKDISQVSKGQKFSMELKTVGDMTIANHLTGDSVHTYSSRQALVPAQKINFRDLMRTVVSPTGSYVHYKESGTEGSISTQTETSAKTQIDYDLTEVKTANEYIAGYTRFSKKLRNNLPFFQGTLPTLLLRDFFKAENAAFWTEVSGASGIATGAGSATDDVEKLIDAIGEQMDDNFNASYILVGHLQMARLNKLLYSSGNQYTGQGGVVSSANGMISIANVPIIAASWVTDDKGLIIDQDYLERIEVEGVKVEFFEEDADNVTKNLITARVECMEAVNLMLAASARYFDFGNLS
jgi:hypothetical protein